MPVEENLVHLSLNPAILHWFSSLCPCQILTQCLIVAASCSVGHTAGLGPGSLLLRQQQKPKHTKGMPQSSHLIFWVGHCVMEASDLLVLVCFLWVSGGNGGLQEAAHLQLGQRMNHTLSREQKQSGLLSPYLLRERSDEHSVHGAASREKERTSIWLPSVLVPLSVQLPRPSAYEHVCRWLRACRQHKL